MESRNDTLHDIPKNYWIRSYVGATIFQTRYILYLQNSNFSEEMLAKHKRQLPKINRIYMCISSICLNLAFSSSPSFTCMT